MEKDIVKWFERMEQINEIGAAKEIYNANGESNIGKGHQFELRMFSKRQKSVMRTIEGLE